MTVEHPFAHAVDSPAKPAAILGDSGAVLTYAQLDERANKLARYLHDRGLRRGDHVAVLLENVLAYFEVVWGCLRAGLYVTPINWHLAPAEAGYIVADC